ncbi:tetratricopeptide repeat protein [Lichenihabitans sp. Uapishka_5]|uniref:tetratricopeptide repeat protein n=1 Tax=Lichenihabitans sp. Uapishka_5 TaxID=3037302 RepID=UPI0029E8161C|nr:tetratricopeptide repeat protein [Lichenihabitans sp. Uapishka_5]MDX7952279.1 tetratricopeptide repeat protein [Lichenihabitans sp. Uapishka_5]
MVQLSLRASVSRSALVRGGRAWLAAAVLLAGVPAVAEARDVITIAKPFEVGESAVGNYLAALVAGADRDTLAAATFFREALRADPDNGELLERTFVAALSNGDTSEGLDFARRLIKSDPKNGLSHLVLGVEQMKDKHYVAARRQLMSGGPGRERDVTATLLTAWTWAGQGDEKKALAAVDSMTDSNLGVFRDYHAALIADLLGDATEATKRFQAAYAADKTILRLTDAYGRFLARHGDQAKAATIFSSFNDVLPHHPLIEADLADLKANKPLQPLIRSAQDGAAEVLYGLGAAGGRQGDDLAALIYLRLSLYLAPDNSLVMVTLADTYARLKQNEVAIDVYEMVPPKNPLRPNADIQTALTLDALDRKDDAIKALQAVLKDRPKDIEAWTTLGNMQREAKHYDDAITSYTSAIDATAPGEKSLWGLLYFRGIAYERDKQWPKAEDDFKRALTLYPDQPLVLNYLGYSWIDKGIHLDEGFKMLRRAVALRPEDGYVVDSLGWAHFKLGEYDEAVKDLERAVSLKPSDPTINDHLGDAYWRMGRKLEAQFQWNHARDLNPDADDLPAIQAKIKDGLPEEKHPAAADSGTPPAPSTTPPAVTAPEPTKNNGG